MGVGPSDFYHGAGHRYSYVEPTGYASTGNPRDGGLFQGYGMPWDSVYLGGVATVLFILWNLVWSVVLNFLLFTYVVQWQILVNVIMMFIELGLIVVFLVFSAVYAYYADVDVYLIKQLALSKTDTVSTIGALRARQSRANINMDLTMCLVLLSFNLWEVALVSSYTWGTVGNAWATKTALDATATSSIATVNYPLTSSQWGSTFTARLVENTAYRSYIHLFVLVKGIVFMVAFFLSRFPAMDVAVSKAQYGVAYDANGGVTAASPEYLMTLNARLKAPAASPLMNLGTNAVPMTTYSNA